MKSIYQDKTFATYWNERAGSQGEAYKRFVLDPIMFKLAGNLKNKTILELGCGNGYLSRSFLKHDPKSLTLLDISKYNLEFAKSMFTNNRIKYLEQDATKKWKVENSSVDLIYSNMMLNEVANIKTPMSEAYRVLKRNGKFIFSVTHPSWDLYIYAQEKAGIKSSKIKGLGNYFSKGFSKYIMGTDSKTNPSLAKKYKREFEVEHYQRPLSDYFNTLTSAGFNVKKIVEPELTKKLLANNPRFISYKDHPIGLIFECTK